MTTYHQQHRTHIYITINNHYSHPLITCPNPTANVNGFCPGSLVDQNFSARLLFFPYPVQCTVTSWPRRGMAPVPARRIVLVKPIVLIFGLISGLSLYGYGGLWVTYDMAFYGFKRSKIQINDDRRADRADGREKIFPPFS